MALQLHALAVNQQCTICAIKDKHSIDYGLHPVIRLRVFRVLVYNLHHLCFKPGILARLQMSTPALIMLVAAADERRRGCRTRGKKCAPGGAGRGRVRDTTITSLSVFCH